MNILIYKFRSYQGDRTQQAHEDLHFEVWQPRWNNWLPRDYPKKYMLFTFFYFCGIFKNNSYYVVSCYKNKKKACSLMIVPKFFKWTFMKKDDVQFIYVKTNKDFRGLGLASNMLLFSLDFLKKKKFQYDMWYVTDQENLASQKLATKNGFEFVSLGLKKKVLLIETLIFKN
jgi:ribosomal protein S18 acetylase RimI-like enzyme